MVTRVRRSQPCIGTGGIIAWQLTAHGKLFHSGLPHKSVNPIELGMEALAHLQRRFYEEFPPHPEEVRCGAQYASTARAVHRPAQLCRWLQDGRW